MLNKIKSFLEDFDGCLDRRRFALVVLPCFLLLTSLGALSLGFMEASSHLFRSFDWLMVLAFLPLILLVVCAFMMIYIPGMMLTLIEGSDWWFSLKWGGAFILGLILPIGLLSYLFALSMIKRLNDLKLSRDWILLSLVPFVNFLFLVYLLLKDSKKNKI